MCNRAPKARNAKAQGNVLGQHLANISGAEGAVYQPSVRVYRLMRGAPFMPRLQRWSRRVVSTCADGPGFYISRLWRLTAITLVISLMSAGVIGQKKYERPPTNTPDQFRGADATAPTDQNSIGDLRWFEVFKDEELQKLVRTALV